LLHTYVHMLYHQGDQIERFLASWVIIYFGLFLNIQVLQICGLFISTVKVMHYFD
jgi:hypothetical protein